MPPADTRKIDLVDRGVLLDAFNAAVDKIEQSVADSLETRDKAQYGHLIAENKKLEAETLLLQCQITSLKKKLNAASTTTPTVAVPGARRMPLGQLSTNIAIAPANPTGKPDSIAVAEHSACANHPDHEHVKEQNRLLKESNKILKESWRSTRKKEQLWILYAEILEKELGIYGNKKETDSRFTAAAKAYRLKRSKNQTRVPTVPARAPDDLTGPPSLAQNAGVLLAPQSLNNAASALPELEPYPPTHREISPSSAASTADVAADHEEEPLPPLPAHTTAESNEATVGPGIAIKSEPSSDPPVVVSERVVRKRKLDDGNSSTSTPTRPAVKSETEDDDQEATVLPTLRKFPNSSIDLDNEPTEVPTPKKRRFLMLPIDVGAPTLQASQHTTEQAAPAPAAALPSVPNSPASADSETNPYACPNRDAELRDSSPFAFQPLAPLLNPAATERKPEESRAARLQDRRSTANAATPLRTLPLEALKPSDFRINPAANDNTTFAYDEVVRHKEERAKLTGCTDPSCPKAKDLHAMVVAEAEHLASTHGVAFYRAPEHVALVERHLGDDAARIAAMDPAGRRALWMQARLQQQANIYGRCRHRFDRAPTPEQYWDTRFPSTQDQERDREEGRRHDRRLVEVRRREAMREGGRWRFKDELPPPKKRL